MVAQMPFEHLGQQAIDGTANGRDLLQDGEAFALGFQRAIERLHLAPDSPDSGQQWPIMAIPGNGGHRGFGSRSRRCTPKI